MLNDESVSRNRDASSEDINFRKEVCHFKKAQNYNLKCLKIQPLKNNIPYSFQKKITFVERFMIDSYISNIKTEIIKSTRSCVFNKPRRVLARIALLYEKLISYGIGTKDFYKQVISISNTLNINKSSLKIDYLDHWGWNINKYITEIYTKPKPKKDTFIYNFPSSKPIIIFVELKDRHLFYDFHRCFCNTYNLIYIKPDPGRITLPDINMTFYPVHEYYNISILTNCDTLIYSSLKFNFLYSIDLSHYKTKIFFPNQLHLDTKESVYLLKNYSPNFTQIIYSSLFHKTFFCNVTKSYNESNSYILNPHSTITPQKLNDTYKFVNLFYFQSLYTVHYKTMSLLKQELPDLTWEVFIPSHRLSPNLLNSAPDWITFNTQLDDYKTSITQSLFHFYIPPLDKNICRRELLLAIESCNIIFTVHSTKSSSEMKCTLQTNCYYFDNDNTLHKKIVSCISKIFSNNMQGVYRSSMKMYSDSLIPTKEQYMDHWTKLIDRK